MKILGTLARRHRSWRRIGDLFRAMMDKLEIPMPESGMATTVEEALAIAGKKSAIR